MKVLNGVVRLWDSGEILLPTIHETYAEKENVRIEILSDGIPFLAPEITLLYKSKNPRPKDEMDFRNTHDNMKYEQ